MEGLDFGVGSTAGRKSRTLALTLLPEIQAFFKSEEGQWEFAEWKAQQQA